MVQVVWFKKENRHMPCEQSFFVIFNEWITLSQQVWLMAVVCCTAGVVVIALSQSMQAAVIPKLGLP
jgi:hypothetical protein